MPPMTLKQAFAKMKGGEPVHFFFCEQDKEGEPVLLVGARAIPKEDQDAELATAKKKGKCIGRLALDDAGTLNVTPKGTSPSTLAKGVQMACKAESIVLKGIKVCDPEAPDGAPVAAAAQSAAGQSSSTADATKPKTGVEPKAAALTAKAQSLAKALSYALTNEPDERLRILQGLVTRIETETAQAQKDGLAVTELARIAAATREQIDSTVANTAADIERGLREDATELAKLVKGKVVAANVPADAAKVRAELLHDAIVRVGDHADEMRGMAMRMKLAPLVPKIGALEKGLVPLRAELESLYPRRRTTKDPTPKKVVEVSGKLEVGSGETEEVVLGNLRKELLGRFKKSWVEVKTRLKSDEKAMGQMWAYRKKVNDALMAKTRDKYTHKKGAVTIRIVGSMTLESDIDVGIDSHGYRKSDGEMVPDYEICKELNDWYQAQFGAQPGTLFDINFYANAPNPKKAAEDMTPVERDMTAMAESGQDVGALMKIRRYMTWEAYDKYMKDVLEGVKGDAELLKATRRQFEEADALYFGALVKLLEAANVTVLAPTGVKGQKAIIEAVERLEEDPEALMNANNEIYVKEMKEVRDLEKVAKTQEGDELAATLAKIRTLMSNSIFFANEAYHSEGTFKHIVGAGQTVAKEADEKAEFKEKTGESKEEKAAREAAKKRFVDEKTNEALGKLSPNEFLQSFNEQLGDLLKDLKHYGAEPYPGLGFYRCSKYMERMCDAVFWIGKTDKDVAKLKIAGHDPMALKGKITGTLVATRKGAVQFTDDQGRDLVDDEAEREAYAIEQVGRLFPGVKTLPALGEIFTGVAKDVNALLRKADVGRKMKAGDEKAYFKGAK